MGLGLLSQTHFFLPIGWVSTAAVNLVADLTA